MLNISMHFIYTNTFFLKSYIVLDYGMSINLSVSIIQYSMVKFKFFSI